MTRPSATGGFSRALVRPPAASFAEGLTTARDLGAPNLDDALAQHAAYAEALRRCGLEVTSLEADSRFPDSTFVEDTAVIVGATAVVTRPGAPSREGETREIRERLAEWLPQLRSIEAPGTLDGGDVCDAGTCVFIGVSERTNESGALQLSRLLEAEGRASVVVDLRDVLGLLHLKSGVCAIGDGRLVAVPALAEHAAFSDFDVVPVASGEEYAANCVRVNEHILVAAGFPAIESALSRLGYPTIALEMSEFRKMDGGLSCLSLRW